MPIELPRTERSKTMHFLGDTSFVTASYYPTYYPTSFYPSFAEAAAFKIPATQLSQSGTRMGVDCLNDRQVLQKGSKRHAETHAIVD